MSTSARITSHWLLSRKLTITFGVRLEYLLEDRVPDFSVFRRRPNEIVVGVGDGQLHGVFWNLPGDDPGDVRPVSEVIDQRGFTRLLVDDSLKLGSRL
jgi:hypothetical protein